MDSWPEDCFVQWGGNGIVLSKEAGKSYRTCFFEAFPKEGSFIRGEGATIREAEEQAFGKFLKESACQHAWSRKAYTNGGAICRKCGSFQTVFQPIVKLQGFRDPLPPSSLELAAEGLLRKDPDDPGSNKFLYKTWLRARLAGIDLPDFNSAPPRQDRFGRDDYTEASREAVKAFLKDKKELLERGEEDGLLGLFTDFHIISLQHLMDEDDLESPEP